MVIRNCTRFFSRIWKFFITPKSMLKTRGPVRMFKPLLPNRPTFTGLGHTGRLSGQPGISKALVSNQRLTDRLEERLPLAMRSGRPPIVLVLDGSKPENDGVKNWPDCATKVQDVSHPPRICCKGPFASVNRACPFPIGRL